MMIQYYLMESFGEWLGKQLRSRSWQAVDLARATGLREGTISRLLSDDRGVGKKSATLIAKALGLPHSLVMRKAGWPVQGESKFRDDVIAVAEAISDWPEDNVQLLHEIVRAMERRLRERGPAGPKSPGAS